MVCCGEYVTQRAVHMHLPSLDSCVHQGQKEVVLIPGPHLDEGAWRVVVHDADLVRSVFFDITLGGMAARLRCRISASCFRR